MAAIGAQKGGVLGDLRWGLPGAPRSRLAAPVPAATACGARAFERRQAASLSLALVFIVIAALLASLYLTQSSRIASTGYEMTSLENRLGALEAERQELLLQIGNAQSPATIEARAAQLGLVSLPESSVQFASPLSDSHP